MMAPISIGEGSSKYPANSPPTLPRSPFLSPRITPNSNLSPPYPAYCNLSHQTPPLGGGGGSGTYPFHGHIRHQIPPIGGGGGSSTYSSHLSHQMPPVGGGGGGEAYPAQRHTSPQGERENISGSNGLWPTSAIRGSPQPITGINDKDCASFPVAVVHESATLSEVFPWKGDSPRDIHAATVNADVVESYEGSKFQECGLTKNERADHELAVSTTLAALEAFIAWVRDLSEATPSKKTLVVTSEIANEFSRICRLVAFHTSLAEDVVSKCIWAVIVKALRDEQAHRRCLEGRSD